MEIRYTKTNTEVRLASGGKKLTGYAAIFNKQSTDDNLGFREVCKPGMFARSIRTGDARCLHNHNPELLLGRTKSGTLRCAEDTRGLQFECDLPNTTTGRDVRELCMRGDLSEMSFGFVAQKQDWQDGRDERSGAKCAVRNLLDVDLLDVSPVTYPAYAGTSASVRSLFTEEIPASLIVECRSRGIRIPSLNLTRLIDADVAAERRRQAAIHQRDSLLKS